MRHEAEKEYCGRLRRRFGPPVTGPEHPTVTGWHHRPCADPRPVTREPIGGTFPIAPAGRLHPTER